MRISDITGAYEISGVTPGSRPERAKKTEDKKDMLALSNTAKDYQSARKALSGVPDIRKEKVDFIKSQIDSNTYNVKASDVAEKLLSKLFD